MMTADGFSSGGPIDGAGDSRSPIDGAGHSHAQRESFAKDDGSSLRRRGRSSPPSLSSAAAAGATRADDACESIRPALVFKEAIRKRYEAYLTTKKVRI